MDWNISKLFKNKSETNYQSDHISTSPAANAKLNNIISLAKIEAWERKVCFFIYIHTKSRTTAASYIQAAARHAFGKMLL